MPTAIEKERIIIENDFLSKELEIKKGKIASSFVLNKLTGETFSALDGSEEFKLRFLRTLGGEYVCASELKISSAVSEKTESGEKLVIRFKNFSVKGGKLGLSLVFELGKLDRFFKKSLVFETPDPDCRAVIDYVDFEPFAVPDVSRVSYLPKQEKSQIGGFALSLGQPVFYGSLVFGCEFPGSENNFENGSLFVRWYCGKPLSRLLKKGRYETYKAVCLVCSDDSDDTRRIEFYDYIRKISRPLELRTQYNSWYDHMLNISAENIETSFLEIDKGLTAVGAKELDCFVVDDGWNDCSKDFWCFNSKFPNELYPSCSLAKAFGSSFGLWLGPRGGYTLDTVKFARRVEKGGNGFLNRRALDVCVASEKYVDKLSSLMLDYEDRFSLSYWKLDGFANKPCRSKNHDHAVGGKNDMYYYSELWERWISVFSALQKNAKGRMFINLTCYAPPSPWFLQYVNSVWMQNSLDIGFLEKTPDGKKLSASKKDKALSYRDDMYYDFYRERGFCFPPSNLYNHDPIYGHEAKMEMTDEQFREYLFTNAARGTSFWELYFSYDMMNEAKWRITNCVLSFVRENLRLFARTVMFGGRPSLLQVYGFGGFDGNEGIVTLRNPSPESAEYTLRLDRSVGADERLTCASLVTVLPYSAAGKSGSYSFGDTLKLSLSPFETRVLHFGKSPKAIEAAYCKAKSENTLEVMFNQTVNAEALSCEQAAISDVKLLDDYRSVLITFEKPFERLNKVTLSNIKDILENEGSAAAEFTYYEGGVIKDAPIVGSADFSVQVTLDSEEDGVLYAQGDELSLSIQNGFAYFKVGEKTLASTRTVRDCVQLCAVRERNGLLKLYFDKKPECAARPYEEKPHRLEGKEQQFRSRGRVRLFDRALAYDEV